MMKKTFFFLTLFLLQYCLTLTTAPQPTLSTPIHLFKERNFGHIVAQQHPEIPYEVITWLSTPQAHQIIQQASGYPNQKEIGYDKQRKEVYTGQVVQPDTIVLTSSGKKTLQETIESLQQQRFSHNFIIDLDGQIYPITEQGESVQEALTHRPFAVGVSACTQDGFTQCRDLNSHSITISLVGNDDIIHTSQQTVNLIKLVAWLSDIFAISPRHVKIYGAIAYPYSTPQDPIHGRRKINPAIPLKELAHHGLALWPRQEQLEALQEFAAQANEQEIIHWISGALRKIGFLCPDTEYIDHPHLKAALRKFQQLYKHQSQDGLPTGQTLVDLNSLLIQHEQLDKSLTLLWPRPHMLNPIRDEYDYIDTVYTVVYEYEQPYCIEYYSETITEF